MNLNDLKRVRQAAGLHVVTFNVWVGQPVDQLKEHLKELVKALNQPHIIVLQEAWRWKNGTIKGYTAVRPTQDKYETDRSTMILVRSDGDILHTGSRRVKGGDWVWNGNLKAPRVFPRVVVRFKDLGNRVFDIIGVHRIPNGPDPAIYRNAEAWEREHDMLVSWTRNINKRHPRRVIVLAGDWNTRIREEPGHPASLSSLVDDLPNPTDYAMDAIDGFLMVNGYPDHLHELNRKFGSDGHHPVSVHVYKYAKEASHE